MNAKSLLSAGLVLTMLVAGAAPALAAESAPVSRTSRAQAAGDIVRPVQKPSPNRTIHVTGQLMLREVDGKPVYMLRGWALSGDAARFEALLDKMVTAQGVPESEPADGTTRILKVTDIAEVEMPVTVTTLRGTLATEVLEGQRVYKLLGWVLLGDPGIFESLVGKKVEAVGLPDNRSSTLVAKRLLVQSIREVAPEVPRTPVLIRPPVIIRPILPPERQPAITVRGQLTTRELEGEPLYMVSGWALSGNTQEFEPLVGQLVEVIGTPDARPSTVMVKQLEVQQIRPVQRTLSRPLIIRPPIRVVPVQPAR